LRAELFEVPLDGRVLVDIEARLAKIIHCLTTRTPPIHV